MRKLHSCSLMKKVLAASNIRVGTFVDDSKSTIEEPPVGLPMYLPGKGDADEARNWGLDHATGTRRQLELRISSVD